MITEKEYKTIQKRLEKGKQMLEGKWRDPKYKAWTDKFEALAVKALNYEIETGILDKKIKEHYEANKPGGGDNND